MATTLGQYYSKKAFGKRYEQGKDFEERLVKLLVENAIPARREEDKYSLFDIELIGERVRLEAKVRSHEFDTYPSQYLPANKVKKLVNAPFTTLFIVEHPDGWYWLSFKDLPPLDTLKFIPKGDGYKAKCDTYEIPNSELSLINDEAHFIDIVRQYI